MERGEPTGFSRRFPLRKGHLRNFPDKSGRFEKRTLRLCECQPAGLRARKVHYVKAKEHWYRRLTSIIDVNQRENTQACLIANFERKATWTAACFRQLRKSGASNELFITLWQLYRYNSGLLLAIDQSARIIFAPYSSIRVSESRHTSTIVCESCRKGKTNEDRGTG